MSFAASTVVRARTADLHGCCCTHPHERTENRIPDAVRSARRRGLPRDGRRGEDAHRSREQIAFVDTRGEQAWSSSDVKIRGAIRIPPDNAAPLLSKVPRDRSVVVYCTLPNEGSSARVARQLHLAGWKDVHALHGGFEEWQRANGAVEPK